MKPIKLNQDAKKLALERFKTALADYAGDGDLTFKITPDSLVPIADDIVKPKVYMTPEVYLQLTRLVHQSSKELAWHGTVTKVGSNYVIHKILVYPQTVTSTTVDADEEAYAKWLMELDDETINHLRFQGHSHVNMGASPSGRDTDNWQKFLNLLTPGDFYVFCIANKKEEFYWNIYDTEQNILFENKDITLEVIDSSGESIIDWASTNIEKYIHEETPVSYGSYAHSTTAGGFNSSVHTTPTQMTVQIIDAQPNKKENKFIKEVPKTLRPYDVQYEPEMDIYYSDSYAPGFTYSHIWGCWLMEGVACRERFGKKPGRPKKENKEQATNKNKAVK